MCTAAEAPSGSPQERGASSSQAGKLAITHHHATHSRPFSILSFSFLICLIEIYGLLSQG